MAEIPEGAVEGAAGIEGDDGNREAPDRVAPGRRGDGPGGPAPGSFPWPEAYYLLTPAFALADGIAGANVRAAAFDGSPAFRLFYYAACMGCALIIHLKPRWAAAVTLTESAVNVGALIVSMMLAYLGMIAAVEAPGGPPVIIDLELVANFVIAGGVGAVAFHPSLRRVEERLGVEPGP